MKGEEERSEEGRPGNSAGNSNKWKCACALCGRPIEPGEGWPYRWGYLCAACDAEENCLEEVEDAACADYDAEAAIAADEAAAYLEDQWEASMERARDHVRERPDEPWRV